MPLTSRDPVPCGSHSRRPKCVVPDYEKDDVSACTIKGLKCGHWCGLEVDTWEGYKDLMPPIEMTPFKRSEFRRYILGLPWWKSTIVESLTSLPQYWKSLPYDSTFGFTRHAPMRTSHLYDTLPLQVCIPDLKSYNISYLKKHSTIHIVVIMNTIIGTHSWSLQMAKLNGSARTHAWTCIF